MRENLRANRRATHIATRSTRNAQATTGKHCTRASSTTNAPCKQDVFDIHNMVTSDLVYTCKIVNGLFSHEFSAQVPNVCGDNGVMAARVLYGRPGTASELYYVAWKIQCFLSIVLLCFAKQTPRTNPPEDRTPWTRPSAMGLSKTDPCEMGLSNPDPFN